jgi:hypothetical protein
MDNDKLTQYRRRNRLLSALRKHGWETVQEAARVVDKGEYESINGVGPVLARVMREWLAEQEDAIQ